MKYLLILILSPCFLNPECYIDEYKTKKGRDNQVQSIVDELSDKFISKVLTPPQSEVKKINQFKQKGNIESAVKNRFYYAYLIHDEFTGIKLAKEYDENEFVKYIKITKSLYRIKDDVSSYAAQNPDSGIKGFDVGFLFEVWSGDLVSMTECAAKWINNYLLFYF